MKVSRIKSPLLMLYLVCLILSLYLIKKIGISSIFDDIIFGFLLLISLLLGKWRLSLILAISMIFIATLISHITSIDKTYVNFFYGLRDYFVPILNILIGAYFGSSVSLYQLKIFFNASIIILLGVLMIGLAFPFTDFAVIGISNDGPDSLRAGLFFTNPNTLAYFVVIALSVIISSNSVRWLDVCVIIAAFVLILFTTSRSGLGIIVVLLFSRFMKTLTTHVLYSVLVITVVPLVVYLLVLFLANNFDSLLLTRYSSLERIFMLAQRVDIWSSHTLNSDMIKIIFGSGASILSRSDGYGSWTVFDSLYLKYFLEIGIFGIFMYALFFLYMLKRSQAEKSVRKTPFFYYLCSPERFICLHLIALVSIAGVVSTVLDIYPINYIIYLLLGVILGKKKNNFGYN